MTTWTSRPSCADAAVAPLALPVDLGPGVRAWFTGKGDGVEPAVGRSGNLSHRRPHLPGQLAADRRQALAPAGVAPSVVHFMEQVHGAAVATVTGNVPAGAELRRVDAAVTREAHRPLAVLTADCVPVLLAGPTLVGVIHAGRTGFAAGIVEATLATLAALDEPLTAVRAAIGPAIGGCCYEVPEDLRDDVAGAHPAARATTTWGTPALDLPAGVAALLRDAGVAVTAVGACTACDTAGRFFSHRTDPGSGRQAGVVVRVDPLAVAA
jgi:polyphenol oxidase